MTFTSENGRALGVFFLSISIDIILNPFVGSPAPFCDHGEGFCLLVCMFYTTAEEKV